MDTMARLGEVVESNTNEFVTQCYELYSSPPLGSLVKVGESETIYGIVSYSSTAGLDTTRRPVARGQSLESEQEVYERHPQLTRLLNTEFRSHIVGHASGLEINTFLSPIPPRIHSFVMSCDREEIRTFATSLDFLGSVLRSQIPQADDVVAAFVRFALAMLPDVEGLKLDAARQLASLLGSETHRLESILRRIR
ncbi:MAG: hypothetical protein CL794_04735 [Chloroflexi bacterium]|nr:hypothetical protein [Chloroflexota bacterium]